MSAPANSHPLGASQAAQAAGLVDRPAGTSSAVAAELAHLVDPEVHGPPIDLVSTLGHVGEDR